jgi:hypothetical protein
MCGYPWVATTTGGCLSLTFWEVWLSRRGDALQAKSIMQFEDALFFIFEHFLCQLSDGAVRRIAQKMCSDKFHPNSALMKKGLFETVSRSRMNISRQKHLLSAGSTRSPSRLGETNKRESFTQMQIPIPSYSC